MFCVLLCELRLITNWRDLPPRNKRLVLTEAQIVALEKAKAETADAS